MSDTPLSLTRNQLAEFLPNQRAVRAFEQLLKQVGKLLPADITTLTRLIEETYIEASSGSSKADQALSSLQSISESLELLIQIPQVASEDAGNLVPISVSPPVSELADVLINLPAAGSVLIYDATLRSWKNAPLTPGTNVSVTNADGAITISVSSAAPSGAAGGVLSGTYPNPGFAVDMATQSELDTAIATREPSITAGTTSQFWRGDKTWSDFATAVRAAVLTGLSTATNAAITAADTVLSAMGKLQAQITGLGTSKADVAQPSWIAPTLLNSWVNNASGYAPAGYFKDTTGMVYLRGMITSGTMSATAFNLPAGYRPAYRFMVAVVSNYALGVVQIQEDGNVIIVSGSNVFVDLGSITFRAV